LIGSTPNLDIIDRLEIADLAIENFWRYIGQSEVRLQQPGHLSPDTVAKGIEYGVGLLGCFIEAYVGSKQGLGREADFGRMTRAARPNEPCSVFGRLNEFIINRR